MALGVLVRLGRSVESLETRGDNVSDPDELRVLGRRQRVAHGDRKLAGAVWVGIDIRQRIAGQRQQIVVGEHAPPIAVVLERRLQGDVPEPGLTAEQPRQGTGGLAARVILAPPAHSCADEQGSLGGLAGGFLPRPAGRGKRHHVLQHARRHPFRRSRLRLERRDASAQVLRRRAGVGGSGPPRSRRRMQDLRREAPRGPGTHRFQAARPRGQLHAVAGADPPPQPIDAVLDGVVAEVEPAADLMVGEPRRHEPQKADVRLGKVVGPLVREELDERGV